MVEFEVGDTIEFIGGADYYFNNETKVQIGDKFIVTASEHGRYNVFGSYYSNHLTNWNSMEDSFRLFEKGKGDVILGKTKKGNNLRYDIIHCGKYFQLSFNKEEHGFICRVTPPYFNRKQLLFIESIMRGLNS